MKRPINGSTVNQYAYAHNLLGAKGKSRKEVALLSGYSMSTASNARQKIEQTDGFHNALAVLATKSNNLMLSILNEFDMRGLDDFTNKDLISALNAITTSWEKIEKKRAPEAMRTPEGNPLRGVFTKRVETQTVTLEEVPSTPETKKEEVIDLDF